MDYIWVNLKNVSPNVFQIYIIVYQNIIYRAGNHSMLLRGRDQVLQMNNSYSANLTFRAQN